MRCRRESNKAQELLGSLPHGLQVSGVALTLPAVSLPNQLSSGLVGGLISKYKTQLIMQVSRVDPEGQYTYLRNNSSDQLC